MTIKVNGQEIDLNAIGKVAAPEQSSESSVAAFAEDLDISKAYGIISSEGDNIAKQIKAVALLSDVKTVESFGYKSSEGIGQNIAETAKRIWDNIVKFVKKIIAFITSLVQGGILMVKAKALQKKVQSASLFAAKLDSKVEWPRLEAKEVKVYVKEAEKALGTITGNAEADSKNFTKVFEAAKQFTSGQNQDELTVKEVLDKLGIKVDENSGVDTTTSAKVNELLSQFTSGQVQYIKDLKEANEISKKALQKAEKLAKEGGDSAAAKNVTAAIQVINHSVKMYTGYANGVLKAINALYFYSTTAKPGTAAFNEWIAKITGKSE